MSLLNNKFTIELEQNNKITFLEILVKHSKRKLATYTFTEKTKKNFHWPLHEMGLIHSLQI